MKQLKLWKWLDVHLEETLMAALLAAMFCVMFVQIILRIFDSALPWAEEFSRHCLIYSGFFSLGYTVRKGNMLKVDVITSMFSQKVQELMHIVLMAVTGLFFGYMCVNAFELIGKIKSTGQYSAAMQSPIYILYVVGFLGFFLGTIRCIQDVAGQVISLRKERLSADREGDI